MRGGEKSWSWIKKGVPLRLEIGPREVDSSQLNVARRNHPHKEHFLVSAAELPSRVVELLDEIQEDLYQKALHFRNTHTHVVDTKEAFYRFFADRGDPIEGGFVLAHWNGDPAVEEKVKQELNVTIRCIPFEEEREEGICIFTGQKSPGRVLFAKAY
jgi:prolyl-tRNA synthetase